MDKMPKEVGISKLYDNFSPDSFGDVSTPVSFNIKKEYGSGSAEIIPIKKGLAYCHYDFSYKDDLSLIDDCRKNFDSIWIYVCLSGSADFTFKKKSFRISSGLSDVFTGGYDIHIKQVMKKNTPFRIVGVLFDHATFLETTGRKPEDLFRLSSKPESPEQKKIPREMRIAAEQLSSAKYSRADTKLLAEAKALEIVSYKMGLLENSFRENSNINNEKSYMEKIYYAAEILEKNMIDPPGIFDLASASGTNHNNLIKGFKDFFGMTPFEYLKKLRLQKAAGLIRNLDLNVTEAAFSVGFSNLSHFSKIFRNEFGMNPSDFQKPGMKTRI